MEGTFQHKADLWAARVGEWFRQWYLRVEEKAPEWLILFVARWVTRYRQVQKKASVTLPWSMIEIWAVPFIIGCFVLLFYIQPVLSQASIHWDAADVHYPLQRYFAERVFQRIPFWTPYVYSGYPILANPEMQAWYPPNWLFYIFPFRPFSVQIELALHAFLACLGAYLFISRLGIRASAAMLGAFAYGFSGFFAGHSSHVPVFMTAAWFPWILWAYRRATDVPGASNIAGGALAGGVMILAGYYQVAVLCFLGLFCYAAADVLFDRANWRRATLICGGMLAGALAISAIQLLPAAELLSQSSPDAGAASGEILQLQPVATLIIPNATGTISEKDRGMVTNHYFYAGLMIVPLALAGALLSRTRRHAGLLAGFAILYMLGPFGGVYWLASHLPGKIMAGPPSLAWFLAALALAWLAAVGSDTLFRRAPLAGVILVGVLFADLWYWNVLRNPLPFARGSFEQLYASKERLVSRILAAPLLPLTRFDAPSPPMNAGPLLHSLDTKFEATYGYLVLQPQPYVEYRQAMVRNAKLRNGLNVSRFWNVATQKLEGNPDALPRAYFPQKVIDLKTEADSRKALATADPASASTVLGTHTPTEQDQSATPFVATYDEQSYRIHYTASTPSLLKLTVSWYPGWQARIDGARTPVLRVDHALMGVVAPPGEHEVEFRFHSNWFQAGWAISVLALLFLCILAGSLHSFVWARIRMKIL